MKTRIRDSYTPKLGDYCNTFVIDKETGNQYLFDADGVWTLVSTDKEGIVAEAVAQANAYTDDVAEGKVDKEEGKGLSENDFTDEDKDKLDSVEAGAQENIIEVVKRNGAVLPVVDKTVDVTVPTATSALTNDSGYITNAVDNLVNYYDKDETDTIVETEALTRDAADQDLQEQIDAIVASSDVVDIVGTYAELQNYDTSKLHDNDIIKVLTDETRDDATTYYRWDDDTDTFTYIGSEGPYYTKGEADATFVPLTRTINGKGLNSDVVLTAADVGALPSSTVIPTVNDATLTIQKNGSTVQTFTANQATNATANIIVPTKTSDLANDGSDNTSTYVESDELATVATSGSYNDLIDKPADFVTDTDYASANDAGVIKVGSGLSIDANGVLSSNVLSSVDWSDVANKPTNVSYWANDAGYITSAAVPTKTSDLTNDSGFITSASIPTKTSDLTNDSGFITSSVNNLANYYKKSETYTQGEVNSLLSAIVVPTKTSDLTNDGSDGTSTYVEADDLATVATSGSYTDLSNKPTIGNATLTIQKNNTNVATFTANASSNVTANITVPTQTSELTNNSGFLTSSTGVTSVNGATGAVTGIQTTGNLVTSVSSSSTNSQYPSAKLFYDTVGDVESVLQTLNNGGGAQ